MTVGDAINCRTRTVPRSSSLTKILDNPDIAVKKITTQYIPDKSSTEGLSDRNANRIVETAVTTNIRSALKAYLVLISDLTSFSTKAYVLVEKLIILKLAKSAKNSKIASVFRHFHSCNCDVLFGLVRNIKAGYFLHTKPPPQNHS